MSDTENIGDDETEKRISKQIELAKSEGLISEEMAKQLQLKRDLLVEQTRLAEKEQLQWQNAVNAKEAAEEELRAKDCKKPTLLLQIRLRNKQRLRLTLNKNSQGK